MRGYRVSCELPGPHNNENAEYFSASDVEKISFSLAVLSVIKLLSLSPLGLFWVPH